MSKQKVSWGTEIKLKTHYFHVSIKDIMELLSLNHLCIDRCTVDAELDYVVIRHEYAISGKLVLPKRWDSSDVLHYVKVVARGD